MKEYTISYFEEFGKVTTVFAESPEKAEEYVKSRLAQGKRVGYQGYNETVHRDFGIVETVEVSNEK